MSKQLLSWLAAALVVGLLVGISLVRTSVVHRAASSHPSSVSSVSPAILVPPLPSTPLQDPSAASTTEEAVSSTSTPLVADATPTYDERHISLTVNWLEYAQKKSIQQVTEKLESYAKYPEKEKDFTKYFGMDEYGYKPDTDASGLWKKGTVKNGVFAKWGVYLRRVEAYGMGTSPMNHYFLISAGGTRAILLTSLVPSPLAWDNAFLTFAPNITFANPGTIPEQITLVNGKTLYRGNVVDSWHSECSSKDCPGAVYQATTKEGLRLYDEKTVSGSQYFFTGEGCFAVFGDDGTQASYASLIPPNTTSTHGDRGVKKPAVQWNAPWDTNATFLSYTLSGCGAHGCTDIATNDQVGPLSGLVQAGTTLLGEPIFVPKNLKTHPEVEKVYENWMQYDAQGDKPSLEVFLKKYKVPLFFWKDGFDRWVRYTNDIAIPVAECGKPVIYLYPEQTMSVNVRLPFFVNVTVSEPTYPRQGWNVVADPNGQLTMKDGSRYGSLFWEGNGVAYEMPREGFIVKGGEVDAFLTSTLAKYGLNEKESGEFRAFWVPRMTGAPYYRVGFLTDAWSKAAPLSVTPKPTTSIRLFMDWRKLGAPISIQEPAIVTPARIGFTLVEWGGTLWK